MSQTQRGKVVTIIYHPLYVHYVLLFESELVFWICSHSTLPIKEQNLSKASSVQLSFIALLKRTLKSEL